VLNNTLRPVVIYGSGSPSAIFTYTWPMVRGTLNWNSLIYGALIPKHLNITDVIYTIICRAQKTTSKK